MSVALTSWAVKMQLSAGVWTDVTADVVLGAAPLVFHYGLPGGGPVDRVASTGWCTFSLDNSAQNSGALLGYYSPGNANVRSGFTWGIPVRVEFTYGGTTYYKWRGKITEIDPVPGSYRTRVTHVRCVDWMDEAANFAVQNVSLQVAQRSDQVFSAVLAAMPLQPAATSVQTGIDTYSYALDNIGSKPVAASVFQQIAQSELGYIYIKGDTTQGGSLVFENRQTRSLNNSTLSTISNTMTELRIPRTLGMLYNRVEATVHPKRIDAAATTILYQQSATAPALLISAGQTVSVQCAFRDPSQSANSLIGGTACVDPVATTDYVANSASNGGGTNLTSNISIAATFNAASATLAITNSGVIDAYMTLLQIRGKGVYDYGPQTFRSEDAAGQASQGLRYLGIDMPFQDSPLNGQGAADYLRNVYGSASVYIESVKFFASEDATSLTAALAREISHRIAASETVSGLATASGFNIQWIEFEVQPSFVGPLITCTWGLTPAFAGIAWILEQVGASELESTTFMGYL